MGDRLILDQIILKMVLLQSMVLLVMRSSLQHQVETEPAEPTLSPHVCPFITQRTFNMNTMQQNTEEQEEQLNVPNGRELSWS